MKKAYYREQALERIARDVITAYDPRLYYGSPVAIPIEDIIEAQGLVLEYQYLRNNGRVLGETIFDDGLTAIYDRENHRYDLLPVKGGTILIDCSLCEEEASTGRLRFTCAHELGHWLLHKKQFSGTGENAALRSGNESDNTLEVQANLLGSTVRLLKANGIGVYFEKENINTLTESSEFLITLFSGFAQAESESLSKNVAWGKQKSAEAGKVTFQYKKMLGYRKGADGQPEIVPEEAEIIRRIYHRYLDGCTLGQIKRELEKDGVPTAQGVERWSPSIIHNILTNEKYIGDALLQKTYVTDCINKKVKKNRGERTMYYVENSHPAIVSRDLFNQVQQEMTRRSSKRKVLQKSGKTELGKYSGKYALTELLVCGECGSPYKRVTWARNGKKRIVWRCVSRLEFGTKYCQHSPTLDEGKLHSAILAAMNEYAAIRQEVCPDVLAMAEEARQALSQAGARLLQLKKRMDAVSREQSDVLDRLLVNMADTELNARMKALTDEKESLKAQIADAQQAEVDLEEQAARRRQMWDSIMECAAGYTEFDNELVRQVIQKITVEDAETIRIQFRDSDVVLEQEVE